LQTFVIVVCKLLGEAFELSGLHMDIVNLSDTIRIFQFERKSSHLQVMLRIFDLAGVWEKEGRLVESIY